MVKLVHQHHACLDEMDKFLSGFHNIRVSDLYQQICVREEFFNFKGLLFKCLRCVTSYYGGKLSAIVIPESDKGSCYVAHLRCLILLSEEKHEDLKDFKGTAEIALLMRLSDARVLR